MHAPTSTTDPRSPSAAGQRSRRRLLRPIAPVALAAFALLLAGCFRAEFAFEVEDDGSGTLSIILALEEDTLEALESFDDGDSDISVDDPFAIDPSELPPGARVEEYNEDGFRGSRVIIEFGPGDDILATLRNSVGGTLDDEAFDSGPVSEDPFESLVLERTSDPDGWRFEANLNQDGLGSGSSDDPFSDLFFEDSSFVIRVKLPGKAAESNADRVDGSEFIWDLDLTADSLPVLHARTEAGGSDGGGLNLGLIIAVVALAGAVGIGATILLRRAQTGSA